jgi:hypothetical protein
VTLPCLSRALSYRGLPWSHVFCPPTFHLPIFHGFACLNGLGTKHDLEKRKNNTQKEVINKKGDKRKKPMGA